MACVPVSPAEHKLLAECSKVLTLQGFVCRESFWLWLAEHAGRHIRAVKLGSLGGWALSLTDSKLTCLGCRVHCECLGDTQEPPGGPVLWAECAPPTDGQGQPNCLRSVSSLFLLPFSLPSPPLPLSFPLSLSSFPLPFFQSSLSLLSSFLDYLVIHYSKLMTNKAVWNTEPFSSTFQLGKNH